MSSLWSAYSNKRKLYCMHWINVYLCVEGPMVMPSRASQTHAVGKPSEMLTKVSFAAGERTTLMLISTLDNDAKNWEQSHVKWCKGHRVVFLLRGSSWENEACLWCAHTNELNITRTACLSKACCCARSSIRV